MSDEPVWVLVRSSDLFSLAHDSALLQHLESLGVDNWSGYCHPENLEEQANQLVDQLKREYLKNVKSTTSKARS